MHIGEELLSYSNTYGKINDLKQELIDTLKTLPEATADRLTILIGMADLKLTPVVEHVIVDEIIVDDDITQIVSGLICTARRISCVATIRKKNKFS
jgi:hypothetical protein